MRATVRFAEGLRGQGLLEKVESARVLGCGLGNLACYWSLIFRNELGEYRPLNYPRTKISNPEPLPGGMGVVAARHWRATAGMEWNRPESRFGQ
jgi:hypothetical protein